MRHCILVLTAVIAVTACGPSGRNNGDDGGDDGADDTPDADFTPIPQPDAQRCEKMDVLFVIDNSGSMGQEQTNLAANFPMFIQVLNESGLDYRVGVTTTGRDYTYYMMTPFGNIPESQDGGDNGRLLRPASCGMTRAWIEKTDPDPAGTFSCVANVGTSGPSDEMPLSSMRDAFEERIADGSNADFHRPDALLGIVILTDENDCSYEQEVTLAFGESLCEAQMEPIANYNAFLNAYTGDQSRWAAVMIAGAGPGDCSSSLGDADEATRLIEFVQGVNQAGGHATISSICEGNLAVGLQDALELFDSACDGFEPIE